MISETARPLCYHRVVRPVEFLLVALFVVCVPVFLVTSNVRWVINAPFVYSYGFDKYEVTETTGIDREELIKAGADFREYFNSDEEVLDVQVVQYGVLRSIYNAREIAHMADVKGLVEGVFTVHTGTGIYMVMFLIAGALIYRKRWLKMAALFAAVGGLLTLGVMTVLGLASLVGFERLFLAFHLISFSNDLWQLDPQRDVLLMMFPQGFFLDVTLWIAGSTAVEACLLSSYLVARWIIRVRGAK